MKGEKWTDFEIDIFLNSASKSASEIRDILFSITGKQRTIDAINQQRYNLKERINALDKKRN